MDLPPNPFKHAIAAGRPQLGLWVSMASTYSAEIAAGSGFDWLVIDTEHSPNEVDTTLAQLQVVAAYPVSAVVRPAWNDKVLIKRHLDIGAQTLLIPYVQNESEAHAAVAAMRFPTEAWTASSSAPRIWPPVSATSATWATPTCNRRSVRPSAVSARVGNPRASSPPTRPRRDVTWSGARHSPPSASTRWS